MFAVSNVVGFVCCEVGALEQIAQYLPVERQGSRLAYNRIEALGNGGLSAQASGDGSAALAHVCAAARERRDDATMFQFVKRLDNGAGVDNKLTRELLDGRELLARLQNPNGNGTLHLINDLEIDGIAASRVDRQFNRHVRIWSY